MTGIIVSLIVIAENAFEKFLPHCVPLYLIPFEEDASEFLIFWSTYESKIGEIKKIESYDGFLTGPSYAELLPSTR